MDPQQWLQNYQARIAGYQRASEELKENLGNTLVKLSSPDESVTVTIGPNGSLKDLQLSHRAAEHSPQQLGALIMQTVARAQRAMAEQVVEAFTPIGGAGNGAALKLMANYLPPDPTEEEGEEQGSTFEEGLAAGQPEEPAPAAPPPPAPVPSFAAPAPAAAAPAPAPAARPRPARGADRSADDEFEDNPW